MGLTPDIAQVMQLGDDFEGKPGPGSLSEAVHMGLPVISSLSDLPDALVGLLDRLLVYQHHVQ